MSSHLAVGHFEITTTLNCSAQTHKGALPGADFSRGPNKGKEEVTQNLNIFPCPLCPLFCFPRAACSVLFVCSHFSCKAPVVMLDIEIFSLVLTRLVIKRPSGSCMANFSKNYY